MIGDWLKKKMAILAIATANVEKNALGAERVSLSDGIGFERKLEQTRLSDALKKGEITQEVQALRWRMYKISNASEGLKSRITGTYKDEAGDERDRVETYKSRPKNLSKIKLDPFDDYPLEYAMNNEMIPIGVSSGMGMGGMNEIDDSPVTIDKDGHETKTLGEVKFDDLESSQKPIYSILVNRDFPSKINIENYTEKIYVRKINEEERLLEFYVNKYPNEYDRKTFFLISEIKKAISNARSTNITDIQNVGLITNTSTAGKERNLLFEYKILGLDKIVEFKGHYLIKFKANILVDGEAIFDKYKDEALEERYEKKMKKDIR